jgi:hypothetical protein
LHNQSRILVDAPPSVAIELCQQENPPRVLVHLVNYDPATSLENIPIKLRLVGPAPKSARAYSPDHAGSRRLTMKKEWDLCTCVLPELKVYAVVVINLAGPWPANSAPVAQYQAGRTNSAERRPLTSGYGSHD